MFLQGRKVGHPVLISETNITRCSAGLGGGGLSYAQGANVHVEDTLFEHCVALRDGGGVNSDLARFNELTLRRVTLRRCVRSGPGSGGGLFVHGTAELIDSHFVECLSGRYASAFGTAVPLSLTMTGGSIRRCVATNPAGTGSQGVIDVLPDTTVTLMGVEIADSLTPITQAIKSRGNLRMTRCRLLRLGTSDRTAPGFALEVAGGVAMIKDTLIEGHTPGLDASLITPTDGWDGTNYGGSWHAGLETDIPNFNPWDPGMRQCGCLRLLGGSTTLLNVTIARCRSNPVGSQSGTLTISPYLQATANAQLSGAHVNIVTGCSSLFEGTQWMAPPFILGKDVVEGRALLALRLRQAAATASWHGAWHDGSSSSHLGATGHRAEPETPCHGHHVTAQPRCTANGSRRR